MSVAFSDPGGRTVLLVDEHPQRLQAMKRMLERRGALVVAALSEHEAYRAAKQVAVRAAVVRHDVGSEGGSVLLDRLAGDGPLVRILVGPPGAAGGDGHRHLYPPVDMDELLFAMGLPSMHTVHPG